MSRRMSLVLGVFAVALTATACGSTTETSPTMASTAADTTIPLTIPSTGASPQPTPATTDPAGPPTTSGGGAVDPNAPEVVEPGDIPDNQVFVAFQSADGSYSVKVPEGWVRTENGGVVVFTDKYNSVTISSMASTSGAVAVDAVRNTGLTDVSSNPTFHLIDVQPVTRKAGEGVLATYEIGSDPNPVTGKTALLAVERYVFNHGGTTVILTLSGANGADNVDPWKVVSDSLTWNG
jgi:hypothetical protein